MTGQHSQGVDPGVDGCVVLARDQRHDLGLAGRDIGVGIDHVEAVGADVRRGEQGAGRLAELHLVLHPRRQAGESVDAVRASHRGCRGVADTVDQAVGAAAGQRHRLAGDARFAAILLAVAVGVDPQPVAQACRVVEAGIERAVVFAGSEHHDIRNERVAVGVRRCAAVRLARADGVKAGWEEEPHLVRQHRGQPHERVMTRGVCRCGGQQFVGVVEVAIAIDVAHQLHGGAGNACFVGVLHAVGVHVVPDVVAQLGCPGLDQDGLVVHRSGKRIEHNANRLPGVRYVAVVGERRCGQRVDIGSGLRADVTGDRTPAQQLPHGTLDIAVSSTWVVRVIPQQPVDTVEIAEVGAGRQRWHCREIAKFV